MLATSSARPGDMVEQAGTLNVSALGSGFYNPHLAACRSGPLAQLVRAEDS